MLHEEITSEIINSFYKVYNTLGYGFLEKVYENALIIELQQHGLTAKQQFPIKVHYEGQVVGEYFADLLVNDLVIVELKAIDRIIDAHEAQLINYLKATNIEVGLVLNFGPKAEFKRKIFSNTRKSSLKGKG
jgi:GxxExxY protein